MLPINLKSRAKCICDKLISNDRVWLSDKQELIIDGDVIPKSNICTEIIEIVTSCPSSGESIQPKRNDISTKSSSPSLSYKDSNLIGLCKIRDFVDFVEISFRFG